MEAQIRALARSEYWQILFRSSKEIDGVHLFENNKNFSGLQLLFLYWLKVYAMLYEELASQEWDNLYPETISDDVICDAFLYWRGREIDKKTREYKKEEKAHRHNKGKKFDQQKSYKVFKGAKGK